MQSHVFVWRLNTNWTLFSRHRAVFLQHYEFTEQYFYTGFLTTKPILPVSFPTTDQYFAAVKCIILQPQTSISQQNLYTLFSNHSSILQQPLGVSPSQHCLSLGVWQSGVKAPLPKVRAARVTADDEWTDSTHRDAKGAGDGTNTRLNQSGNES